MAEQLPNPEKIPVYVPEDTAEHDPFNIEPDTSELKTVTIKKPPEKRNFFGRKNTGATYKLRGVQRIFLLFCVFAMGLIGLFAAWLLFKDVFSL